MTCGNALSRPVCDTPRRRIARTTVVLDHEMARNTYFRDGASIASFITYVG
jgi:hypothetical protein